MSDAMCCPLSEPDDRARVYHRTTRRAGKPHVCCECRQPIAKGAEHSYVSMLLDGAWSTWRTCLVCAEIGDHFACGGRIIGTLWYELEESFFPDMTAGGQCMDGLSPSVKAVLFERRMAWLFDRRVERDGAPPPSAGGAP